MTTTDRRRFPRVEAEISCKCRRSAHTLYSPARTIDISAGGALIELHSPRHAEVGDRISIAFNHPSEPLARATRMIDASVVRATEHDGSRQELAIRFDLPHQEVLANTTSTARQAA